LYSGSHPELTLNKGGYIQQELGFVKKKATTQPTSPELVFKKKAQQNLARVSLKTQTKPYQSWLKQAQSNTSSEFVCLAKSTFKKTPLQNWVWYPLKSTLVQ
jgi:hypothetical protein